MSLTFVYDEIVVAVVPAFVAAVFLSLEGIDSADNEVLILFVVCQALRAETANISFAIGVVEPQAKGFLQAFRDLVQSLIIVYLTDKVIKVILIYGSDLFEHHHRR